MLCAARLPLHAARLHQCTLSIPAGLDAAQQHGAAHAELTRGLGDRVLAAAYANAVIAAAIVGLLTLIGPAAIGGLVVAVRVNAVKGEAVGARTHVSKESGRVRLPSGAHHDAPATVPVVLVIGRIEAARFRRFPRPVLAAAVPPGRVAMLGMESVPNEASAAAGVTGSELTALRNGCCAALAATVPVDPAATPFGASRDEETGEALAGEIDEPHVSIVSDWQQLGGMDGEYLRG